MSAILSLHIKDLVCDALPKRQFANLVFSSNPYKQTNLVFSYKKTMKFKFGYG